MVSFDIYDNKPTISSLLKQKQLYESSFSVKKNATRGFMVIQASKAGINTKEYRNFRSNYANLDVTISMLEKRNNGAIIRGIFTYNEIPKSLLQRYEELSELYVEILDDQNNVSEYFDLTNLEDLMSKERYRINIKIKEEKAKNELNISWFSIRFFTLFQNAIIASYPFFLPNSWYMQSEKYIMVQNCFLPNYVSLFHVSVITFKYVLARRNDK